MDALIQATIDLEIAVDDYAAVTYAHATTSAWPKGEDQGFLLRRRIAVVDAATALALAMADADVNGGPVSIVPESLREEAAEAEIRALHGENRIIDRAKCRRCAGTGQFITYVENGVPKGPGGPCYRCGGKGYQTNADRRRNYGHDYFAPIML